MKKKEKCDNCGDTEERITMECNFCNEKFCSECASHHRGWCLAEDEWDFK